MFVKKILDFDSFSNEADVIVSDNQYEVLCYCYPVDKNITGKEVKEVVALFSSDIARVDNHNCFVKERNHLYEYLLCGKVVDIYKSIVAIGNINISLNCPLPRDIIQGEYVEFKVDRLDCIIVDI